MRSADDKKYLYEKSPLIETICQLRFPSILSIDAHEPADFQDTVRDRFPRYSVQNERLPPAAPGGEVRNVKNYSFISEDGSYKLSLTKSFIALSTMRYTSWEDFAQWLDEPLGQFIRIYRPAYFERIGLRYVNGVSREKLELSDCRWNDLFQSQYLSVLDSDEIDESAVTKCSVDLELRLDERTQAKIHAGPGYIKRSIRTGDGIRSVQEKDTRFIFDQDIFSSGNIKLGSAAETLDAVHSHADRLFSEAITDVLHKAMEPTYIV